MKTLAYIIRFIAFFYLIASPFARNPWNEKLFIFVVAALVCWLTTAFLQYIKELG